MDDLDRCLPAHALEVLESMKLFFDIEGFIFVVGLDESVVERAVISRFASTEFGESATSIASGHAADTTSASSAQYLSREYVKKIFQVPYTLPPIAPAMLDELLESIRTESALSSEQWNDLATCVQPYLKQIAVNGRLNPREVKRFVNSYTLQTKIRPELRPDVVLALQAMLFRYEWRSLYNLLLANPTLFVAALEDYRGAEGQQPNDLAFANLDPQSWVPSDLAAFMKGPLVRPVIEAGAHGSLPLYLSSLAQTTSTPADTWLITVYLAAGELRRKFGLFSARQRVTAADLQQVDPAIAEVIGGISEGMTFAQPLGAAWENASQSIRNLREALELPDTKADDLIRLIQSAVDDIDFFYAQVQIQWASRQ